MTTKEIKDLKEGKIVTINSKVGKLGKMPVFQVLKNTFMFSNETLIYVVLRAGVLKYFGNALVCIYEGKENVDYKKFNTPEAASKFLTAA